MAEKENYEPGEPFYPNHITKEVIVAYLTFGVLLILLAVFPPHLHPKADPMLTPPHIKPEWYFLSMYQFLKLFPPQMPVLSQIPVVKIFLGEGRAFSIIIQGIAMLILLLVPFIDRNPERHPRKRPFAIAVGILGVIAVVFLSFWGRYS
jgi:quinol-cytochrome oxidoreductase complex cytochrome b subunit